MKKINRLAVGVLSLSAFLLMGGCQQNSSPAPAANQNTVSNQNAGQTAVTIQGMAFDKNNLTVSVGTTVTWTNQDSVPHTVTSDNGLFDSGNFTKGQSYSFTFTKEGTYTYHCTVHPSMTGTVTVTP